MKDIFTFPGQIHFSFVDDAAFKKQENIYLGKLLLLLCIKLIDPILDTLISRSIYYNPSMLHLFEIKWMFMLFIIK